MQKVLCATRTARAGARRSAGTRSVVTQRARPSARPAVAAPRAARRAAATRAAAASDVPSAASPEALELKAMLMDSFWGTERGLAASSDSRAEINELITQVRVFA